MFNILCFLGSNSRGLGYRFVDMSPVMIKNMYVQLSIKYGFCNIISGIFIKNSSMTYYEQNFSCLLIYTGRVLWSTFLKKMSPLSTLYLPTTIVIKKLKQVRHTFVIKISIFWLSSCRISNHFEKPTIYLNTDFLVKKKEFFFLNYTKKI